MTAQFRVQNTGKESVKIIDAERKQPVVIEPGETVTMSLKLFEHTVR